MWGAHSRAVAEKVERRVAAGRELQDAVKEVFSGQRPAVGFGKTAREQGKKRKK